MKDNFAQPIVPKILSNAPEEVMKIYEEWKERYERLHSEDNKVFVIQRSESHGDIRVDLTHSISNIKRIINPLNKKVRDAILKRYSEVNSEKLELGKLKKEWQNWQTKSGVVAIEPLDTTIIELLGQYKNKDEVKKIIYDCYGVEITDHKINQVKLKSLDKIDKLKSEWEDNYDEFSVSRKKGRIERLVYLLQTQTEEYKRANTAPVSRSKEIRETLEQIRKEIEGDKLKIDINGNIDINASIAMNMNVMQITQKVSINSLIIGLVAAKRGLDPTALMASLTNSYYKVYNGFNPAVEGGQQEMTYPSTLINNYDWEKIRMIHENNDHIEEAKIIEESPTNTAIDMKQKLMEMMKKGMGELEKTSKTIKKDKDRFEKE